MLASRYAPYDQGRGRDAGADDWADKPFDTQQLIDKVRKVLLALEDPDLPKRIPAQARRFVEEERTWAKGVARYRPLYERVAKEAARV